MRDQFQYPEIEVQRKMQESAQKFEQLMDNGDQFMNAGKMDPKPWFKDRRQILDEM